MYDNRITRSIHGTLTFVLATGLIVLMAACSSSNNSTATTATAAQTQERDLEAKNKEIALAFFHGVFTEKKPQEAFDKYSVPEYIQHNPLAEDGAVPTIAFLNEWIAKNPESSVEVKKVIAEGNLVAIHHHLRQSPDVPGLACTEWYRLENGKVVEHWDTAQPMPTQSKNPHPMF
jgi:predicted SnoaL-like aldol condensation-catalyzing enzyme